MAAEFHIITEPGQYILIDSEDPTAFQGTLEGEVREEGYLVPFTRDNALAIRKLLRGRTVEMAAKDRATMAYLADSKHDPMTWSVALPDLVEMPMEGKFGKIKTLWDLLHYLPLRFIDKSNPQKVDDLELGKWAVIVGEIVNEVKYDRFANMTKIVVEDVAGKRISAQFFRQKWMQYKFSQGDEVVLYGKYSEWVNHKGYHTPQISNAAIDKLTDIQGALPMIPVYPQKAGDKTQQLQRAVHKLLDSIVWIEDPVPAELLRRFELMGRNEAYRKLHFPENREDAERARERLAFDEYLRLQGYLYNRKLEVEGLLGKAKRERGLAEAFRTSLPFQFTGAQNRVIEEIQNDLGTEHPMYRLLQGDVGAGKSEVAEAAALTAIGSGYQVAYLAPTEVLAQQLYDRLQRDFARAGFSEQVRLEFLTGTMKAAERKPTVTGLADGSVHMVVGTHAVIQKTVSFQNLGLIIIDEAHKWGTRQRSILREQNSANGVPDLLLMTATPIPRTTAQVVYGDMEISILDEMPQGRKPIDTHWLQRPNEAWDKVREQVSQGHQAYVVTALVEDSETLENVESALTTYESMRFIFPEYSIGLLHGQMSTAEKETAINDFYANETQVLVATTVVEVGVNVPNATVMTVLDANRFGIASLHQIRGRVGRGDDQSYCYLVGEAKNAETEERLNALVNSTDGFWLAEKDLEIRGEGALFGAGAVQSGRSTLFVGNLREHRHVLERARRVAKNAVKSKAFMAEVDYLYKDVNIDA